MNFCPRCHYFYADAAATSRRDNETEICPACWQEEALVDFARIKHINLAKELYRHERTLKIALRQKAALTARLLLEVDKADTDKANEAS